MRRPIAIAIPLLAALAMPPGAQAQMESREGIALQNQILQLRAELQQVEQGGGAAPVYRAPPPVQSGAGGGANEELVGQLLDRVSHLEDQVRSLRGRVDQLQNAQQQAQQETAKQIGDLSFQAQQHGGGGGGGGTAAAAPPVAYPSGSYPPGLAAPPAVPPPLPPVMAGPSASAPSAARRTPEMAMQEGNLAYGRHDYPAAETAAREVLAGSKGSPRATDAQYLLAQSESGERNYQQAAVDYYDAYNRAPKAARASEALLGVANALIALNDKRSACQALDKVRAEFPSPRSEVRAGVASARTRAGCHG